jgi:hypothetical protein
MGAIFLRIPADMGLYLDINTMCPSGAQLDIFIGKFSLYIFEGYAWY